MAKQPLANKELIETLKIQASLAREERAKTDALFLSIGEGVIATDENGKIIRVNDRALKLLGFKRNEVIGQWFPKKIKAVTESGEPVRNIDRPMVRVFVDGKVVSEQIHYLRKDGSIMPVQVNVSPIMLRGQPVGAIEIFRDITVENEMEKLKADFISLASHQLRTPLSAVQTYSNMLMQGYVGTINDQQLDFLKTILSASERMNELISTLLNITRIEADNLLIHSSTIDISALVRDIHAEFATMAAEKNITITINDPAAPHVIDNDGALIHEVLSNLLTNAIKYTPDNGRITISLKRDKRNLIICVRDSGYGIPLADQDRIFTKFYRGSNILKRDTTGTGLGLYLVKNIAEKIGGELRFISTENKGTSFELILPAEINIKNPKITL